MAMFKRYPFTNDYVFKKTLSTNKHITQQIIKVITGNDVTIDQLQQEVVIDPNKDAPSVRYDVFLVTNENSIYDIEMQNYSAHNLLLRARYYVSANDVEYEAKYRQTHERFTYYDLPSICIIFICTFDPFNEGQLMYITKNTIFADTFDKENIIDCKKVDCCDKVTKIFINASKSSRISYNEFENKDLVNFIKYIQTEIPCDKLTNDINDCVDIINEHDRGEIMTFQDHFDEMEEYFLREGRKEGLKEGKEEGLKEGMAQEKEKSLLSTVKILKPLFNNVNDLYKHLISVPYYMDAPFAKVKEIYDSLEN